MPTISSDGPCTHAQQLLNRQNGKRQASKFAARKPLRIVSNGQTPNVWRLYPIKGRKQAIKGRLQGAQSSNPARYLVIALH